jgi:hypothetical protein
MYGNSRWPPGAHFDENITILPVDHHGGHKVGPVVFILGKNIAKCKDQLKSEIQNEAGLYLVCILETWMDSF